MSAVREELAHTAEEVAYLALGTAILAVQRAARLRRELRHRACCAPWHLRIPGAHRAPGATRADR